jgi:hypothetical protein
MPGLFDLAKNAFGDYYLQHVGIVKSRERGFWQSISKDPVKSAPIRCGERISLEGEGGETADSLVTTYITGCPFGFGCRDPRSQKRDLGHPTIRGVMVRWIRSVGGLRGRFSVVATVTLSVVIGQVLCGKSRR